MKKIINAFLLSGLLFASCNKEPKPLSKEEIRVKTDSLTKIQISESNRRAQTDLEYRIKIEVKVKADSIINAKKKPAVTDTAKKTDTPKPKTGFFK